MKKRIKEKYRQILVWILKGESTEEQDGMGQDGADWVRTGQKQEEQDESRLGKVIHLQVKITLRVGTEYYR